VIAPAAVTLTVADRLGLELGQTPRIQPTGFSTDGSCPRAMLCPSVSAVPFTTPDSSSVPSALQRA
jgi:hypothetical protein